MLISGWESGPPESSYLLNPYLNLCDRKSCGFHFIGKGGLREMQQPAAWSLFPSLFWKQHPVSSAPSPLAPSCGATMLLQDPEPQNVGRRVSG